MSEGSWLPKTWGEAVPQVIWGVLILGFGLEFCVSLLNTDYGRALLALVGLGGLLFMLIHAEQLKRQLLALNPNWIFVAFALFLAVIVLSPFVEEKRWPFSAWFVVSPPATAAEIAKATAPIVAERNAETQRADKAEKERDTALAQLAAMTKERDEQKQMIAALQAKNNSHDSAQIRRRLQALRLPSQSSGVAGYCFIQAAIKP